MATANAHFCLLSEPRFPFTLITEVAKEDMPLRCFVSALVVSALLALPVPSSAQTSKTPQGVPLGTECWNRMYEHNPPGQPWKAKCTSDPECTKLEIAHACNAHGIGCGRGPGNPPTSKPDLMWQSYVGGALLGGTTASFQADNTEGKKPIMEMGMNWGGWTLGAVTLINVTRLPPAGFGVSAAIATTSVVAGHEGYKNFKGREDGTTKEKKEIVKEAVTTGAIVGAAAYGALKVFKTSPLFRPVARAFERLNIVAFGRRFLVTFRW